MKVLKDIKELLEEELKEIKKRGSFTPADLEIVHKAVETVKLIDEICDEDEDKEYEKEYSGKMNRMYSRRYMPLPEDHYDHNGWYSGNGTRAGERVYSNNYSGCYSGNRDHMGRYSREGATSHMIARLEEMLDNTCSEREREAIRSCIDKLSW